MGGVAPPRDAGAGPTAPLGAKAAKESPHSKAGEDARGERS